MAGTRQQMAPPRHSGARSAVRTRRRKRNRVRRVLVTAVSLLLLVTAGAGWVYLRLSGNIETFSSDGISGDRPDASSSKGTNVLVIGSDARTLSFVMSMKNIELHNAKFVTAPWQYQGARVTIVEPDVDALWAALKADRTIDGKDASGKNGDETASASPSASADEAVSGGGIDVAVHNGTTVTGLAADAARTLKGHDFTVTSTATAANQDHSTTVIEYGPGQKDRAKTVARLFPAADLRATTTAGINVILGRDYADSPAATASDGPATVPSEVAHGARSADDDLCTNLSYG
ncbi:LytR C-terminal domain-containing protein [Streptomyces sp. NPDC088246]|uniref:LytR C-terminal domain-containing protein n=1 Tax=Streptomyces sp. NPDC088246 TaxID=3365842 RepID=UPI0038116BAD